MQDNNSKEVFKCCKTEKWRTMRENPQNIAKAKQVEGWLIDKLLSVDFFQIQDKNSEEVLKTENWRTMRENPQNIAKASGGVTDWWTALSGFGQRLWEPIWGSKMKQQAFKNPHVAKSSSMTS